ncbi:MAG: flagellar hook protein FlgE [Mariniblastus sp.]
MTQSLLTGASGLLAHQRKLDVVANNIANVNTNSYKTQRSLFSDLIYTDRLPARGPSDNFGGVNPQQIGNGVSVAQITRKFEQGVLTSTGEDFDFAIQGDGFFMVSGEQPSFTRDGSFGIDGRGYLVDPATGAFVQRFGSVGEGSDTAPAYQVAGDNRIAIPLGASIPGRETSIATMVGNLPSNATPPLREVLTTSSPFEAANVAATAATLLNDLDLNAADYEAGDEVEFIGTNADGSSFSASLPVGPATTLGDLVDAINAEIVGATLEISPTGNLVLSADVTGEALLSLSLQDAGGNVGSTEFSDAVFVVETEGKDGDKVEASVQVFDKRGQAHAVQLELEKKDSNVWDATFSSASDSLTMVDGLVASIIFQEDGTFQTINGTGEGDANIEFSIDSLSEVQTVSLDLTGLTHRATSYSAGFDQDGYPPGNIVAIDSTAEGVLTGLASNGVRLEIAQLAVANFSNNQALENVGGNYYTQTVNSGEPVIGFSNSGSNSEVRGGQLESSNVDIALEFTQLIIAQRGFSANARTITVATEILQELNQIFR